MGETAPGRAARIRAALDALAPLAVSVIDESARHAGHAGARPEGETHFAVRVVAETFAGESRVARQRRVNALLAAEFGSGLHALSLSLMTPKEAIGADASENLKNSTEC